MSRTQQEAPDSGGSYLEVFVIPALLVPRRRKVGKKSVEDPSKPPRKVLVGYYTKGKVPNWTRMKDSHAMKDLIRASFPPQLRNYVADSYDTRMRIDVKCYFESKLHCDPENARKLVVDAITEEDKWVFGSHDFPHYDKEFPRMEVTVTLYRTKA